MDLHRIKSLSPRQRALVAISVLLDGRDATVYLGNDAMEGQSLQRAAEALASQDLELRMILAATILRAALKGEE